MTIIVVTPEHGERSFDADEWETLAGELGDEGNLWIGKDEVGVAEFAKGAWLFVYEVKDPEPKQEPVTFAGGDRAVVTGPVVFLGDEPFDELEHGQVVVVEDTVDEDGDVFVRAATGLGWYIAQSSLSPFTGVLDA